MVRIALVPLLRHRSHVGPLRTGVHCYVGIEARIPLEAVDNE